MQYLGDYAASETVYFMWNSVNSSGASVTRSTNGTISVYKDNNTTQTTTGVTDTEDFDSLTGVHHCAIATSDSFYTTGTDFMVVLSGATIDSQTVNAVLAHFSIENRAALRPTTAGRTLDVTATGAAGVDWANVESQSTSVNLSATTVATVGAVTGAVGSVTGAVGSVTGDVNGDVVGSVGSIGTGGISSASFAAGAISASALAADTIGASELAQDACQEIADEMLNRNLAGGGSGNTRSVRNALRSLRNRQAIVAGTLTVYQEDDASSAWTAAVTTTAGNPLSEVDPA